MASLVLGVLPFAGPVNAGWDLNGSAVTSGAEFVLTPALADQVGSAWTDNQINLNQNFDISMAINLGTLDGGGADGISFAFHRDPSGTGTVGGTGGGGEWIGMYDIYPALCVEVDTYQNSSRGDPANDHIGISEFPADGSGVPNHSGAAAVNALASGANIEDGANHTLRIAWNATTKTMTVYFDGALRVTYTKDIVTTLFGGSGLVWFGFAASTGGAYNRQSVTPTNPTLTATKLPSPTSIPATGLASYQINATNGGASTAFISQLVDTLPAGFAYVSGTSSGMTTANPAISGQVLTWYLSASVAPGTTRSQSYQVTAPLTPGGYVNRFGIRGDNFTPVSGAGGTLTVRPIADLSITKNHLGSFTVGSPGTYEMVVTNSGPHDATGPFVVTDVLPAGLTYSSSSASGWTVNTSGAPTITWTRSGTLASGASLPTISLTVAVGAAAVPSRTNSASVTGASDDLVPGNNTDSDVTTILGAGSGNKPLYLIASNGLSRAAPAVAPAEVTINGLGAFNEWTLTPVTTGALTLTAGTIPVRLWMYRNSNGSSRSVTVSLASTGTTTGAIGTAVTLNPLTLPTSAATEVVFSIPLASPITLAAGSRIVVRVTNNTSASNRRVVVVPKHLTNYSRVVTTTSTVIQVTSVSTWTAAWPGGTASTVFTPGSTAWIRAVVSDPFGAADITSALVDIERPSGFPEVSGASMTLATSTSGTKTFESSILLPMTPTGTWLTRVRALEGSEGTVNDVREAEFVVGLPDLVITKTGTTSSDPTNGTLNPKSIPGALVEYEIEVRNQGVGQPDADQLEVVDQIPDGSFLVVDDFASPGSGPVNFVDGLVSSGLSYTFSGLNSATDDVAFSDDHGMSFGYQPTIGVDGTDPDVTHIRVTPQGVFLPSGPGGDPEFRVQFNVRVR